MQWPPRVTDSWRDGESLLLSSEFYNKCNPVGRMKYQVPLTYHTAGFFSVLVNLTCMVRQVTQFWLHFLQEQVSRLLTKYLGISPIGWYLQTIEGRWAVTVHPCHRSLPAQPIHVRKAQSRKKAHKPLHTLWISQNAFVCRVWWSYTFYFDYRINKWYHLNI